MELLDETPAMCYWIRELRIKKMLLVEPPEDSPLRCTWTYSYVFDSLVPRLERLNALVLHKWQDSIDMRPPSKYYLRIKGCLAKCRSIRNISFVDCFMDSSLVRILLSGLPNIESVSFVRSTCHFSPGDHDIHPMRRLRSMSYTARQHWVPGYGTPAQLATYGSLSRWMARHDAPQASADVFRLSIGNDLTDYNLDFIYDVKVLPVEEIAMGVSFKFLRELRPQDYARVDTYFALPSFPSLKKVYVVYAGPVQPKRVQEKFKKILPNLTARGIDVEVEQVKVKRKVWLRPILNSLIVGDL
ncbi:hypothetical protein EUX98_g9741 [Antrodiella citrinella]|uniref:F-box domain-containing protein n=1 Tax=Antrodiella citrinella TaxID=2447956 RepID=A0A4S4LMD7_9APHY|nr:hypothetical protein EUX98_g9741 [Antrodiella citrinella]